LCSWRCWRRSPWLVERAVRKKKPLGRLGKKKSKLPAGEEPQSEE